MSDPGASAGEVGGIFAGAVTLLATVGAGVRWLMLWGERRAMRSHESREAKMARWHSELEARERRIEGKEDDYLSKIEKQLIEIRRRDAEREEQLRTFRLAFELVAGALRVRDPSNIALRQAEQLLAKSFPLEPVIPLSMQVELGRIDAAAGEALPPHIDEPTP
jgi:hypothetical protein